MSRYSENAPQNVLLLCMSKVGTNAQSSTYIYRMGSENQDILEIQGYMTNEAPAKAVISYLDYTKKETGGKLDRIVMICTDAVYTRVELNQEEDFQKEGLLEHDTGLVERLGGIQTEEVVGENGKSQIKRYLNCTHVGYLKSVICDYARRKAGHEIPEEAFKEIHITNIMDSAIISKAAIEAADDITSSDRKSNLYIDFNGGLRDVAYMLLSIANLMKLRGVTIQQILTMNFENKVDHPSQNEMRGKKVVEIRVRNPLFESVDLIAGIDEYIRYGRIQGLKSYFASDTLMTGGRGGNLTNQGIQGSLRTWRTFPIFFSCAVQIRSWLIGQICFKS